MYTVKMLFMRWVPTDKMLADPMTKLDLLPAGRNDNDVVDIDEDDAEEEGITTTTTTTATTGSLGGDVFFASFGVKAPSEPGELGMDSFELKFIVDGVWKIVPVDDLFFKRDQAIASFCN